MKQGSGLQIAPEECIQQQFRGRAIRPGAGGSPNSGGCTSRIPRSRRRRLAAATESTFQEAMMQMAEQLWQVPRDCTVFTMRIRGSTHRCAVSQEALYLLSQTLDPRLDRIDAYLALRRRVGQAAKACMEQGAGMLPLVLEARHLQPCAQG
jgi:hypothetical protein